MNFISTMGEVLGPATTKKDVTMSRNFFLLVGHGF